jgi:large repetitive protein
MRNYTMSESMAGTGVSQRPLALAAERGRRVRTPGPRALAGLGLLALLALACSSTSSPGDSSGDPVVGRWTLTGSMSEGRAEHASVLLPDGRVLVVGGCWSYDELSTIWGSPCKALASAEIYDPVTAIWTPTGSMSEGRRNAAIALLKDGKVLVAGGADGARDFTVKKSAEIYDPATGLWSPTGSMALPRGTLGSCCAVTLPSGRVLMVEGYAADFSGGAPFGELYDPATGVWEPTGPLVTPRFFGARSIQLPSGQVLVVGGKSGPPRDYTVLATAELYDPARNAWEPTGALPQQWSYFALTLLPTGDVLLAGGITARFEDPEAAEVALYTAATGTWRAASSMHLARREPRAVVLPSGRVLVTGNWTKCLRVHDCDPYMAPQAEVYDPWLDTWTLTPEPLRYVEDGSALLLLPSGQALLTGGLAQIFGVRSAQVYQE